MMINAHTHQIDNEADISVISLFSDDVLPNREIGLYVSVGIHPWHVNKVDINGALSRIKNLCKNKQLDAIGECGLDKYHQYIEVQKEVFKAQISLSEEFMLPLIIHSVKTHHLLLNIRKETKAIQPWILHGFSGSIEDAQRLIQSGMYLSFGTALLSNIPKIEQVLKQISIDNVLFETDDDNLSVVEVYKKAQSLLNLTTERLQDQIRNNFNNIFVR